VDKKREASKVPSRANETTIFKSLGMAVEDIVAALLVYRSSTATHYRR
jgi:ornithine cyclodeaminase/alanine dehydrogenase-like protein (mu-crystallin family)